MYRKPVNRTRMPYPVKRAMPTGSTYLGEDSQYYYWMNAPATDQLGGMFDNIGNMFTRMVKFTPKSFTPGNIYKGLINTTLTTVTGGLYQVLPKHLKKTVYEVGKVAVPVVAGGVLAYAAGPSVWGVLGPKLAQAGSLLKSGAGSVMQMVTGGGKSPGQPGSGQPDYSQLPGAGMPGGAPAQGSPQDGDSGVNVLQIGGKVIELLGKLPQSKQAEVAEKLTPEQIAYMEKYGQIPPELRAYFDQMAQSVFNAQRPEESTGAAGLYNKIRETPGEPVQAGMFGSMDPMTLGLLIGVPTLFFLMSGKK